MPYIYYYLEKARLLANNGLVLKAMNKTTESNPQIPNPAKRPHTDSLMNPPIKMEMGMDNMVETKPVIAAPIPAI